MRRNLVTTRKSGFLKQRTDRLGWDNFLVFVSLFSFYFIQVVVTDRDSMGAFNSKFEMFCAYFFFGLAWLGGDRVLLRAVLL